MKSKQYQEIIKLILIGDTNVGKTSIMKRYCYGTYNSNQKATIGLQYGQKIVTLRQRKVLVQLWDTAGQQKFKTLTPSYYRSAMGIILVFSVDDKQSFNSISLWIKQIRTFAIEQIPIILVCNKADLTKRQVSQKEAVLLGQQYKLELIFTSCKQNSNIEEIINRISHMIDFRQKKLVQKQKTTSILLVNSSSSKGKCYC